MEPEPNPTSGDAKTLEKLLTVGLALSSETDIQRLFEFIVSTAHLFCLLTLLVAILMPGYVGLPPEGMIA